MSEYKEIQRRLVKSSSRLKASIQKGFTNLMMMGKVKQAIKLIDDDSDVTGVHEITERVKNSLEAKHPDSEKADESVVLEDKEVRVENVIFEGINK